jgi:hypothetical protein
MLTIDLRLQHKIAISPLAHHQSPAYDSTYLYLHHMHFILSDLKCYDSVLPQALEIMFEVHRKRSNEKITREKQNFQLTRHFFSSFFLHFFSLDPSYFKTLINFLFHIILNDLKCYRNTTWSSNINKATYKEFLGCSETGLCSVLWFFLKFLNPLLWGPVTFSFLIHFKQLLVCQMYQRMGFKFVRTPWTMEPSPWIRPALSA